MEYSHRMWGRVLGLVFAIPAAVFVARGIVTPRLGTRLELLFLMGGTQGVVGWWMVKSGLQVRICQSGVNVLHTVAQFDLPTCLSCILPQETTPCADHVCTSVEALRHHSSATTKESVSLPLQLNSSPCLESRCHFEVFFKQFISCGPKISCRNHVKTEA